MDNQPRIIAAGAPVAARVPGHGARQVDTIAADLSGSNCTVSTLVTVGWREYLALPDLGLDRVRVKVDSGARSSALHATDIHRFRRGGAPWVRFDTQPNRRSDASFTCEAPLVEDRWITDSGGHRDFRPVVLTTIEMAGQRWPAEVSLGSRATMKFRMLLGRTAMRGRPIIDPASSFRLGR